MIQAETDLSQVDMAMILDNEIIISILSRYWGDIVSQYAMCTLTKESDRFIAMSGIAKTFQEVYRDRDRYLAGLWERTIWLGLSWRVIDCQQGTTRARRRSESYAPVLELGIRSGRQRGARIRVR